MGNLGLTVVAILLLIRYTKFHFLNSLREVNLSREFCEKNTRSKMYLKQLSTFSKYDRWMESLNVRINYFPSLRHTVLQYGQNQSPFGILMSGGLKHAV